MPTIIGSSTSGQVVSEATGPGPFLTPVGETITNSAGFGVLFNLFQERYTVDGFVRSDDRIGVYAAAGFLDFVVGATGVIEGTTGHSGIDNTEVTNFGRITGFNGNGISSGFFEFELVNHGLIEGTSRGVRTAWETDVDVKNTGMIHGDIIGAELGGYGPQLINRGDITGGENGLKLTGYGNGFTNFGTIASTATDGTAVLVEQSLGYIENVFINRGIINGNLIFDEGDDVYAAHDGSQTNGWIKAGGGNDLLIGYDDNDLFYGEGGNDTLRGQGGDDILFGGAGRDVLQGGADNDRLRGGIDVDHLIGGSGNDDLRGNTGNDILRGDAGHDNLEGGAQDDWLLGGIGNDTLDGGPGDDLLRGEGGEDLFAFADGFSQDRILDWDPNEDVINFFAVTAFNSYADVQAAMMQVGPNVRIAADADNAVLLTNTDVSDLSSTHFEFTDLGFG